MKALRPGWGLAGRPRSAERYGLEITDDLVSDRDGFHPKTAGHRRIADEFLKVILPALGLAPTV